MKNVNKIRKIRIYYNPKSLQKLCDIVVSKHPELERKLFLASLYGVDYKYNFERYVDGMLEIIGRRYVRDEKPFEKWFTKLVAEKMNLLLESKDNVEMMITIAESLENRMLKFKRIYGIVLEVYYQNMGLLLCLRNMR